VDEAPSTQCHRWRAPHRAARRVISAPAGSRPRPRGTRTPGQMNTCAGADVILSSKCYVYLWADGIHVRVRLEEMPRACWRSSGPRQRQTNSSTSPTGTRERASLAGVAARSVRTWRHGIMQESRGENGRRSKMTGSGGAGGLHVAAPMSCAIRTAQHRTKSQARMLPRLLSSVSLDHTDDDTRPKKIIARWLREADRRPTSGPMRDRKYHKALPRGALRR
jgi:hypothetical protein